MNEKELVREWTDGQFEYVGQVSNKKDLYYLIKCLKCGEVFIRAKYGIRDRKTRCPKCYKPTNKQYLRRLERAATNEIERKKEKICVICGGVFHNSDERRKTCSPECAQTMRKSNSGLRRFRHKGGAVKDYGITLKRIYERDGGKCWICGKQTDFNDVRYTTDGHKYCGDSHPVKDHIVPLAYGGEESWENIKLACWRCNKNKSDAIVDVEKTEKGKRLVVSERCGKRDGSIAVMQYTPDGELVGLYKSMSEAARKTGIAECQIAAARTGRQRTAHGYIWKTYKEQSKG